MGGGGEESLHVLGGAGVAGARTWAWSTLNKTELGTRLVLLKLKEKRVKIVCKLKFSFVIQGSGCRGN